MDGSNFKRRVFDTFEEVRKSKELLDVTLSCGLGQHLEAHQLLLSSCSSVLRDLLRHTPHSHPLLLLQGVDFQVIIILDCLLHDIVLQELQSVVDFCYTGEVRVAQERLRGFMALASQFQVMNNVRQGVLDVAVKT